MAGAAPILFGGLAAAPAFPTKPVTIVVPSSADGPADTVSRLIAQQMTEALGQAVRIDRRAPFIKRSGIYAD